LDNIITSLSVIRQTLTDLTITAETAMVDTDFPMIAIEGSFARIASFDKLRRLDAPLPFLVASMPPVSPTLQPLGLALPRNLEELVITDDLYRQEEYEWVHVEFFDAIRSWIEDWKAFTPHLRRFCLNLKLMDYELWDSSHSMLAPELRDLGARVGLHVDVEFG
jgi:hypothetical protein